MANIFIQNVALLNQKTKTCEKQDILIENGTVMQMGRDLKATADATVIDGTGKYVSAGWIDAHAHLYTDPWSLGLDRDSFLPDGVTFVVDAGSSGPENFEHYLQTCGKSGNIQGRAYLNLAPTGITKGGGELLDLSKVSLAACEAVIAKYPEEIIGVKLRIDPRVCEDPWKAMDLISELSKRTGKPLIVHASRTTMPLEDILAHMKSGDIFAHSFADKAPGLLDENGHVKKCAWEARDRGVYFDLSHGKSNFSFAIAKAAVDQGFLPDAISTDLHAGSLNVVGSLALTMSKMLACGLDLWQTVNLVTADAAKMLQIEEKATEIVVGQKTDLTLFEVKEGSFVLTDSDGKTANGRQYIKPYCAVLGENVYYTK